MISPTAFLKQVWDELQKVVWPTQNEIIRLTVVVILVSILVGLFIGTIDFILVELMRAIIK
ncbi:MAG: preprotein translocase subunit SecE [Candidatus Levybacteria bacterium RIFCSPHIGHO2_12_FULL_38_12]|nr:MAG: preprotein translocase subunit SecE [Candidatus Levybacteria bacterium RIFCSPHIGHO2_01_FULL_38_12]OGH22250.1 MAG: preprotein translocase subunit SecE [Candidatus Levybacteria bacterium RIFCSPHIGHO2_12_FULL_38_12]OGH44274.1 MAG: preprotein translocase subunit SecE [Candidatus Levybacteria bacterium RIFCSPLOWO2_02_FULL_37_18]OGH51698.1 MAG: preprotein translocase subunit SecE [Candidatus Levybacteria bacterium RIFCSPLOWO2_12_FULL_37_7]